MRYTFTTDPELPDGMTSIHVIHDGPTIRRQVELHRYVPDAMTTVFTPEMNAHAERIAMAMVRALIEINALRPEVSADIVAQRLHKFAADTVGLEYITDELAKRIPEGA